MAGPKIGVWLVGARGGVASTVSVGLAALQSGAAPTTAGLVTELPEFSGCGLASWDQLVLGGHEIRGGTLAESVQKLEQQQGAIPPGSADLHNERLLEIDRRIRPGVIYRSGPAIESMAQDAHTALTNPTPREAIGLIEEDLRSFQAENGLDRVTVVLLLSAEPTVELGSVPATWDELEQTLDSPSDCPLSASSLYAIAALRGGMPVVNFTPALGADCPAIEELARAKGTPHTGSDGKTGETLLKSVLAPMFRSRRLEVMSWVSHNLLGNQDGRVLSDPEHRGSKLSNKQALLEELLGADAQATRPQSLVSIESVESFGDWKTAWNHVHFRGFLGVPMTLQFTWQGCDSVLAAPLVLDLVRLVNLAADRGVSGAVPDLGAFFKRPNSGGPAAFDEQMTRLTEWARGESS